MKKSVKWMIGISISCAVFFIIAIALFFTTINVNDIRNDILNNGGIVFNKRVVKEVDFEKQESIENVDKIEIDIGGGNVELQIVKTEGNLFRAVIDGKQIDLSFASKGYDYDLRKFGNSLRLDMSHDWIFGWGIYFIGDVILEIPDSYDKDIKIEVGSGKVYFSEDVNNEFRKFELKVSSGDVKIGMINCAEAEIDIDSGNISVEDCVIKGKLKIDMDSGDINLKGDFGALEVEIDSGDINLELTAQEIQGDCKIDIDSGDIRLKLPENASYTLSGEIDSGRVVNNQTDKRYSHDFSDVSVNGGGDYKIEIDMSSGSVIIN